MASMGVRVLRVAILPGLQPAELPLSSPQSAPSRADRRTLPTTGGVSIPALSPPCFLALTRHRSLAQSRHNIENRERPLYGSAVPMRLQRLADDDIAAYVGERFRQTGRGAGEALHPLVEAAKGHPQRSMLLAHRLWAEVPAGERATLDHWQAAHRAALAELDAEFDAQWRGYDTTEQKTLRALVAADGSPYRAAVLQRLDLTADAVKWALPRLEATAEIEKADRKRLIVDPLFAEWIAILNDGSAIGSDGG